MSEDDVVGEIFGWVGTALATYFYISPVVPFIKLIKGEITYKESPGVLLLCSFMNCILWVDYGLLQNNFQVYFANGLGGSITLIFITIFLIYVSELRIGFSLLYNFILIAVITGISLLCFYIVPSNITGTAAMIFNVLMYAAPGEKIMTVCKTGNYNLIPIWSTIGGTACSTSWGIFGVYKKDLNLIIPNVLGVIFSILQIVVFLIFKNKEKQGKGPIVETEDENKE